MSDTRVARATQETQGREHMNRHRTIVLTVLPAIMMVALASIAAPAMAGSLLSGYGGPGAGNQAILGSALLGGTPGGGRGGDAGGGSAGGSNPDLAEPSKTEAADISVPSGRRSAGPDRSPASGRGGVGAKREGATGASGGVSGAYPASERAEAAKLASDGSETLGLSGKDLLYVLLAFGVLAFSGVLTRRMTQPTSVRKHG